MFVLACLAYKPYFFSQRTIFFSHTKSANSTFSHDLSAKQAKVDRAIITEVLGINEIIIHIYGLVMLTKEYCMDRMSQVVVTHRARVG